MREVLSLCVAAEGELIGAGDGSGVLVPGQPKVVAGSEPLPRRESPGRVHGEKVVLVANGGEATDGEDGKGVGADGAGTLLGLADTRARGLIHQGDVARKTSVGQQGEHGEGSAGLGLTAFDGIGKSGDFVPLAGLRRGVEKTARQRNVVLGRFVGVLNFQPIGGFVVEV